MADNLNIKIRNLLIFQEKIFNFYSFIINRKDIIIMYVLRTFIHVLYIFLYTHMNLKRYTNLWNEIYKLLFKIGNLNYILYDDIMREIQYIFCNEFIFLYKIVFWNYCKIWKLFSVELVITFFFDICLIIKICKIINYKKK